MSVCLDADLGLVSSSNSSHLDGVADDAKTLGLGDITAELTFSRGALSFGF